MNPKKSLSLRGTPLSSTTTNQINNNKTYNNQWLYLAQKHTTPSPHIIDKSMLKSMVWTNKASLAATFHSIEVAYKICDSTPLKYENPLVLTRSAKGFTQ